MSIRILSLRGENGSLHCPISTTNDGNIFVVCVWLHAERNSFIFLTRYELTIYLPLVKIELDVCLSILI